MKRILTIVLLLCVGLSCSMAQQAFYIYRQDGTVRQFLTSEVTAMECSMIDEEGETQEIFCTQLIHLGDSLITIPLSQIDSISFLPPAPEQSVSPAYVPIDWTATRVASIDTLAHRFTLEFADERIPGIQPGSVVLLQCDSIQHIVLVTDVERRGQQMIVSGENGTLAHIFFDTEFTLMGGDTDQASRQAPYRYYPMKSGDDRRHLVRAAAGTEWNDTTIIYQKEFPGHINFLDKDTTLHAVDMNVKAYVDYKTELSLAVNFKIRFGDPIADKHGALQFLMAQRFDIDVNVTGTQKFEADLTAEFEGAGDVQLHKDGDDNYELVPEIKIPSLSRIFMVGYVPVEITIGGDFYRQVSLTINEAKAKFTMGFDATSSTTLGMKYNGITHQGFDHYFIPKFEKNPHNPTLSGKLDVEGKFYFFPRFHVWLYNTLGMAFDIKPFLHTQIKGGFHKDLIEAQADDYMGWSLTNTAGIDWALGWSANTTWFNHETWNSEIVSGTFTPEEWLLYHSPEAIGFASVEPKTIKKGQLTQASVEVKDRSILGDLPTPLPQVVKFETSNNGKVETSNGSAFGFTQGGRTAVSWTPSSDDEVLYARIYDKDGEVVAEASYGEGAKIEIQKIFDIGGTKAKALCHVKEIPVGAECGINYWIDGTTSNRLNVRTSDVYGSEQTHTFTLTQLQNDRKYICIAYAKWDDEYYESEPLEFYSSQFSCPDSNHPHPIDLGLPSGTKWACCNLDATAPIEVGGYYAWGETKSRDSFDWSNYQYSNPSTWDLRYIGNDIAGTPFDAVRKNMGKGWQMPNETQRLELQTFTTKRKVKVAGQDLLILTGPSGESIYLPLSGLTWQDVVNDHNVIGYYWLSNIYEKNHDEAKCLYFFDSSWVLPGKDFRGTGLTIRGVQK